MDVLEFGTDGWRDVIADRFTYRNVARCAQAYAEHLLEAGQDSVVVGYDTRFGGESFARLVAEVMAANGLTALLSATFVPTPALSFAVTHFAAGGGVMLSASHNPPQYNGLKVKGSYGGSATDEVYRDVAARVATTDDARVRRDKGSGKGLGSVEIVDIRPLYFQKLAELIDVETLRGVRGTLVHDAMGGAAAGWLSGFVHFTGLEVQVEQLRKRPDPLFHGVNPEPLPPNMATTIARAQEGDLLFASATDGDGDRLGLVLPGGKFFNSHQIFAVLLDLMQRRGGSGRVVKTFTVSRLIERLAQRRGLEVVETPVGFKHIVEKMLEGDVLIGGEESGGIGVAGHIPERDGIANTLLILEAIARSGMGLEELFAGLEREADWHHAYDRADLHLESRSLTGAVMAALADPPQLIAGRPLTSVETRDGVKLNLGDSAWLLVRASGTEPLLRIYAEAPSADEVATLLAQAKRFVAAVPVLKR
ncbi:MAG: phosphoglucomutase/phosphomannomutase family protein [Trueperaceae bacterium]